MLKKGVISILSPIESFKPIIYLDTQSSTKKRNEMAKNPIAIEAYFYEANEISYPG